MKANDKGGRQEPGDADDIDGIAQLLGLWSWQIVRANTGEQMRILGRLDRALRLERRRGIAGHWTYDLNRHAALRAAQLALKKRWRWRG